MKFVELFDSRDKKRRLSHIRNLIILAIADGHLDQTEKSLITTIAIRVGITPSELDRLIDRPGSINFYPPSSYRERIEQLFDMVLVMMADGEIHDNELTFCKAVAARLGFHMQIIDAIIESIIDSVKAGLEAERIISRLMQYEH